MMIINSLSEDKVRKVHLRKQRSSHIQQTCGQQRRNQRYRNDIMIYDDAKWKKVRALRLTDRKWSFVRGGCVSVGGCALPRRWRSSRGEYSRLLASFHYDRLQRRVRDGCCPRRERGQRGVVRGSEIMIQQLRLEMDVHFFSFTIHVAVIVESCVCLMASGGWMDVRGGVP